MAENTRLWDKLGKTDPANTKSFKRAGGFSGTAIKPMWSFRRMTEEFGPVGLGWGVNEPSFQVVNGCDGEVLVYCTVSVWYNEYREAKGKRTEGLEASSKVFGVGGDKVVVKQSSGLRSDDEAFKKAYTDAIGNALKLIGVGADVHMGLFDDSKYVQEMEQEFSAPKPPSKAASRPVYDRLSKANKDCIDKSAFDRLWTHKATLEAYASLPDDWKTHLDEEKTDKAAELDERAAMQADGGVDPNESLDRIEKETRQ